MRDPRLPALVTLILANVVLAAAALGFDAGAAFITIIAGVVLTLLALPPWRDTSHGPAAGAAVLAGFGVLVLALAWLLR